MVQEQYAKLPVTVRRAIELVGIYYLFAIILVGKDIIMPLLMAFFLAIMLLPVFRFFHRKKLPEVASTLMTLLLLIIVMAALVWFFSAQVSSLVNDFPVIKQNVTAHLNSISAWISSKTNYTTAKQVQIINEQSDKLMNYAGGMVSGAFGSITSVFVFVALLPIYIFLMLFYRNLLLRFVFLWFPKQSHEKVEEAVRESQTIIKSYLVGLAIQITYITILLGGILFFIG